MKLKKFYQNAIIDKRNNPMSYNEIRQTASKKDFTCKCGKKVQKGSNCIVDPKKKIAYCSNKCAKG